MAINEDASAARIVAVLEELASAGAGNRDGLSVTEIAKRIGRDKSSVSRQLKTLTGLGLVEKRPEGGHVLGWRLFTIAASAGDQRLLQIAPPVMRKIGREVGERVHLSVRHQDQVLTILTEGPQHVIEAVGWVGRTVPILGTSSGYSLLFDDTEEEIRYLFEHARSPQVGPNAAKTADETVRRIEISRIKGFALTFEEFEAGLSAVGAPVRDSHGHIIAALNISAPSYRIEGRIEEISQLVARAAKYLSHVIGDPAHPDTNQTKPYKGASSSTFSSSPQERNA